MSLLLLCLKIFFVRIIDVSLGTFRTIITVKGKSLYASIIGFLEVFVWFIIVREALNTDIESIWIATSYSLGFATGTYIGSILSNKFIEGNLSIQIITSKYNLVNIIRKHGYGVSVIKVNGKDEKEKYMLFIEIKNKSLNHLRNIVISHDKDSFLIVTETKLVQNGFIK
ncbi:MAG: DUF5698 domain-containing protein [bacterium]|nr:DUF5698 domain-containing protein [bacterium]